MEVLSALQQDASYYEDRRWFSAFDARCSLEGIDYKKGEILESAQKILRAPLVNLFRFMEEVE